MKKLKFEVDGHVLAGFAKNIGDELWVHFEGRTFLVSNKVDRGRRDLKKAGAKSGNILSPMPGKITKILVEVGAQVEENQSIIVMEAMKMEYSLKSQIAGTVKEILCEVNNQVTLGAKLAVIEEPS